MPLHFLAKPVITCAAKEIEAMKGEKVTIECLISARPALTMVTWFNQDTGSQIGRAEDKPDLGLKSTVSYRSLIVVYNNS